MKQAIALLTAVGALVLVVHAHAQTKTVPSDASGTATSTMPETAPANGQSGPRQKASSPSNGVKTQPREQVNAPPQGESTVPQSQRPPRVDRN